MRRLKERKPLSWGEIADLEEEWREQCQERDIIFDSEDRCIESFNAFLDEYAYGNDNPKVEIL
jgi:hypothetical protein